MGAIGSGKTTLIEEAIKHLKGKYKIAVIAGDVIAEMDASRFQGTRGTDNSCKYWERVPSGCKAIGKGP